MTIAPVEVYLLIKVALISVICGLCRPEDLTKLGIDNIQELETLLFVSVKETKTKADRMLVIVDGR